MTQKETMDRPIGEAVLRYGLPKAPGDPNAEADPEGVYELLDKTRADEYTDSQGRFMAAAYISHGYSHIDLSLIHI